MTSVFASNLFISLMLTSTTLVMLLVFENFGQTMPNQSSAKPVLTQSEDRIWQLLQGARGLHILRTACLRVVDVAAPFMVALQLGGFPAQLLLLVKIYVSSPTTTKVQIFDQHQQGLKGLPQQRAWTLASLIFSCLIIVVYSSGFGLSGAANLLLCFALMFSRDPPHNGQISNRHLHESQHKSAGNHISAFGNDSGAPPSFGSSPSKGNTNEISAKPTNTGSQTTTSAGLAAGATIILWLFYVPADLNFQSSIIVGAIALLVNVAYAEVPILTSPSLLAIGLVVGLVGNSLVSPDAATFWRDAILAILTVGAVQIDTIQSKAHWEGNASAGDNIHRTGDQKCSWITRWLLRSCGPDSLLYGIIIDKESRRIFYFMFLNLCFMLVQSLYGVLTGSLGLLSDSIHMFFDCVALFVGLCAAVMRKWPPSMKYPYGYGKIDTLSGFGNGVFLMLISIEIIWESVERLVGGSDLSRTTELLVVSVLGLLVNLVGIMAFDHGHVHGHEHGHSHGHVDSHGLHHHHHHHHHSPTSQPDPHTVQQHSESNSSTLSNCDFKTSPSKDHHGSDNMYGIYLHIMADTLGSGAVVLSTLCVKYTGWSGFDPLASSAIAILIFASAVPLIISCGKKMLLSLPSDVEYTLRETLAGVSTTRGVVAYTVPKFWLDDRGKPPMKDEHGLRHCHDHTHSHQHQPDHLQGQSRDPSGNCGQEDNPLILGVMHVVAAQYADLEDVRARVLEYLSSKNMDILVQVEREGDTKCWCNGTGFA